MMNNNMRNIQEEMKTFFSSSCYAYCLAYKFGESFTIFDLTRDILSGYEKGFIESDGYVSKPIEFIKYLGPATYTDVQKVPIMSLKQLPDNNETYIVEYKNGIFSHFVVVYNGQVIFDPAGDSNTVKYGKPVSWRKYI